MLENLDVVAIAALLPLTACMLVTQVNPYHALIIRGILGAVAALVYALFGAADVALTEALVGTMLSITLYAIAVRSSMSLRLGTLATTDPNLDEAIPVALSQQLFPALRQAIKKHHLRLEVLPYASPQALQFALENKEIHAVCVATEQLAMATPTGDVAAPYLLNVRIPRLYEILAAALSPEIAAVNFSRALRLMPAEPPPPDSQLQNAVEG
jgi:putative multicomponent Na+:H+ antiporter subunit B